MRALSVLLDEAIRNLRGAGLGAIREVAWRTYLRYGRRLSADPVFEDDWDVLVVLDACRADLWTEVVGRTDDLPVGTTRISPGGTSAEWLTAVFGDRARSELADVGYVTGNPYSDTHVDGTKLGHLEEVWRTNWDDTVGTIRPRPITNAAVRVARERDLDRLIVHYMQPHFPSLAGDRGDGIDLDSFGEESLSVWEDLRFGRRSATSVWRAYKANLRIVLEDVRLLLSNVDADRAVITADHGNAVGECGLYGHARGVALSAIREVPWAVTSATDRDTYHPEDDLEVTEDTDVAARLEDLGYR